MVKQGKYENTIEVVLTEKEAPILFRKKLEELMEQKAFNSEDEAKKWIESTPIVLCLVYHKHSGMFAVEDEAVDSTVSPYDGKTGTYILNEDPDYEPKVYYQPEWYGDDGTNIEYGGLPDGLYSFQVFPSREVCEDWLRNNGYDPGDFVIHEYEDDDIEDYILIDEDGNTIQSAETEEDLDNAYNELVSLIPEDGVVFEKPVTLYATDKAIYGEVDLEHPTSDDRYQVVKLERDYITLTTGEMRSLDALQDLDDYKTLINAVHDSLAKTTEKDIATLAELKNRLSE